MDDACSATNTASMAVSDAHVWAEAQLVLHLAVTGHVGSSRSDKAGWLKLTLHR